NKRYALLWTAFLGLLVVEYFLILVVIIWHLFNMKYLHAVQGEVGVALFLFITLNTNKGHITCAQKTQPFNNEAATTMADIAVVVVVAEFGVGGRISTKLKKGEVVCFSSTTAAAVASATHHHGTT
ncbi:hypothetical protein ACJX0J_011360, partial [Zea mays]